MLADRQYMRRDNVPAPWSVTIVLLVFNVLVFFLEYSNGAQSRSWFLDYGALSLEGLKRGFIWQFITFQFLHDGLPHLVLNSIGLYFFGRPLGRLRLSYWCSTSWSFLWSSAMATDRQSRSGF